MTRRSSALFASRSPRRTRILQAIIPIFVAAAAASIASQQAFVGALVALLAVGIALMSVTGRCPLPSPPPGGQDSSAEPLIFEDARGYVDIFATGEREQKNGR